jgi:broad specificity phosphatase PhoE
MSEVRFVIIRHGSTSKNAGNGDSPECIRGWADLPLAPKGVKEAHAVAKELKRVPMDALYSSDLDRAERTAHIISEHTKTPILGALRGLRPWDAGALTGKRVEDCHEILMRHITQTPDKPLSDGESFNTFRARARACILGLMQKHDGECIGIVTHHRVERLVASGGLAVGPVQVSKFNEPGVDPADFVIVTCSNDGDDEWEQSVEGDDDNDAAKAAPPAKKKRPWSDYPWTKKPFDEPNPTGADGKGIFSRPVGTPGTGRKDDPLDLRPLTGIVKREDSWRSAVRNSLLER